MASTHNQKKRNSETLHRRFEKSHSYSIQSDDDVTYSRNRNFLKPIQVLTSSQQNEYSTPEWSEVSLISSEATASGQAT